MSSGGFVSKHPYLTFFLGLVAIGGVVQIVYAVTPTAQKLAGAPKGAGTLPPKPAGT